MVRESIRESEDEARYDFRIVESEFDKLPYSEILFRNRVRSKRKYNEIRDSMITASYNAWQILRSQGLKKDWKAYQKMLGLISDKKKIDKTEKTVAIKSALGIHELIQRSKNGKS